MAPTVVGAIVMQWPYAGHPGWQARVARALTGADAG
jgi:hypothetical protein